MGPMKGIELEQYEAKARARLMSMGFEMASSTGLWATVYGEYLIDFSEINPDSYLIHAMRQVYTKGYKKGQESIKEVLRDLIK